jgi:hypothetical protein
MKSVQFLFAASLAGLAVGGCTTVRETLTEAIAGTHRATLDGAQVVGAARDADGYATAELSVADALDQICYDVNDLRNVGAVTSATINRGARGVNGPAVLTLRTSGEGDYKNCVNRCKARYKNGPFPGLKRGQSLQTKSLDRGRGVIGVGEAAVA